MISLGYLGLLESPSKFVTRYISKIVRKISLTEQICSALGNDKFACDVFIDLQKALHTVNHNILTFKLEHYGICNLPLSWFQSYLKNIPIHFNNW